MGLNSVVVIVSVKNLYNVNNNMCKGKKTESVLNICANVTHKSSPGFIAEYIETRQIDCVYKSNENLKDLFLIFIIRN